MSLKKMTFLQACKDFFGLKEGQTSMQFAQEIKPLTEQDKQEIKTGLQENGYEIMASASMPA